MAEAAFKLVAEVEPTYCPSAKLFKWISPRSGLQVVLIQRQSPSVSGYFTVATEANDESGCPHTLEHVVFMGSQKYPYKGLLDKLGTKQLSVTNAWTTQDHTCYTLDTAGFEGFSNLLPVYLDHILHATVKDAACLTEVYHIDGKGEEKGVVFSEMQGHEHSSETLISAEIKRQLYAAGSGYSTDTGGKLDALRVLDWDTIKEYHSSLYHAGNLSVIVCGNVSPDELLNTLSPFEAALPDDKQASRPFVDSRLSKAPSPLSETITSTIVFPDSSETAGEVAIAWLGPPVRDTVDNTALQVISSYLSSEGSGKLNVKFINVPDDQALASSTGTDITDYLNTRFEVWFYGVPTEKLTLTGSAVLDYLNRELLSELDFSFLRQCIDRVYDTFVMSAEEDWDIFIDVAINEFVYGNARDGEIFNEWFGSTREFDVLRSWSEDDWKSFVRSWVVNPPKVCVLGTPSRAEHTKVEKDKRKRLKSIRSTSDLSEKQRLLDGAIEQNEQPIPSSMLDLFPEPDSRKIRFISSKSAATPKLIDNLPGAMLKIDSATQSKLLGDVDLAIDFEGVKSQFVTIKMYITPIEVDKRLLPLVDVLLANTFAMPMVMEDGSVLSGSEVAKAVDGELLDKSLSRDYELQEMVLLEVKAKSGNYRNAVKWIQRAMLQSAPDEEHVALFIAQHLKALAADKRSESALLRSSISDVLLTDDSLRKRSDALITENETQKFASDVPQTLADVKQLAKHLYRRENIRILVIADLEKVTDPLAPWKDLDSQLPKGDGLQRIPVTSQFLSPIGQEPSKKCVLTLCAASESSNVTVVANGPRQYGHEDLPALALVNAYLEMTEGPFWKAVRGPGFAYGAFIRTSVQLGKVVLSISSAADVPGALNACRKVVESIATRQQPIDQEGLKNGISVITTELASYLSQVPTAVKEKFMDTVMKGYEPDYVYSVLSKIQSVAIDDFIRMLRIYLLPLFDASSSAVFVVAPPSDQQSLTNTMTTLGYDVEVREVEVEDSDDDESGSDDGDDDEEGEEDEDMDLDTDVTLDEDDGQDEDDDEEHDQD